LIGPRAELAGDGLKFGGVRRAVEHGALSITQHAGVQ
jgi:hypothetical protein